MPAHDAPPAATRTTTRTTPAAVGSAPPARPGWIRRVAAACATHPWLLGLCLTSSALATLVQGTVPLLTGHVVSDAVAHRTTGLRQIVIALLVLAVANFALTFARRYLGGALSLDVQLDLRNSIFRALQRLDAPSRTSCGSARWSPG